MSHPLRRIADELRALARKLAAAGKTHRAKKARKAARTLYPKPTTPVVPTPPVEHGFMPEAINENIAPGSNDPAIIPVGVIYHVAVSQSPDIRPIFTDGRGIESHFYVEFDGTIRQYRSIFFEADAQFAGNSFGSPRHGFVSIETEGMGSGKWTAAQIDALTKITLWVRSQSFFPLRVCPAWNLPGVGYHSLFPEWNTDNHSCPGPARITQFHDTIVPWLATLSRSSQ